MFFSLNLILPDVALYTPEIRLYSVDLPAPLGPIREWISPFLIFKSTPLIILVGPKSFFSS